MAWCGFNLCEMWLGKNDARWADMTPHGKGRYFEDHFHWIADWGFNFVRLPLAYSWWASVDKPLPIDEKALEPLDQAVQWGQKYGLHVCINIHHAPGYCINQTPVPEPYNLWRDNRPQEAFIEYWRHFAKRYRGISADKLSFNLLNEPKGCSEEEHASLIRRTVRSIRSIDPTRPIIIDGRDFKPCPELADLKLIQSCRGYHPSWLTHYQAWWAGNPQHMPEWPPPANDDGQAYLDKEYAPWVKLQTSGVQVHCGECGSYNRTPHEVMLSWLADLLAVLNGHNFGFALWNLCGAFGILDSGRKDARYEDWYGHHLDAKMLDVLRRNLPA